MKQYGLFVGINTYDDKDITNLSYAKNDAESLCAFFATHFEIADQLTQLPTRKNILAKVEKIAACLHQDDQFFFFFSGHGCERDGKTTLICKDAHSDSDRGVITLDEILARTNPIRCQRFFIIDCCRTNEYIHYWKAPFHQECLSVNVLPPCILFSCQIGQTSMELARHRHGAFTYALLNVLKQTSSSHFADLLIALSDEIQRLFHRHRIHVQQTPMAYAPIAFNPRIFYPSGHEPHDNPPETIKRLRLLAEQDNMQALFSLGEYYFNGLKGIKKNPQKALIYYRKAAKLGHREANFKLNVVDSEIFI